MRKYTQDGRAIKISDFGLGKDIFLLSSFSGNEYISDLFRFEIRAYSENLDISPTDIVGNTATVHIDTENSRVFHGYISEFSFGEIKDGKLREYTMTMVPWLWLLSKNNTHRIFQEKNTKDIVSEIFSSLGLNDFDFQAAGGKPREYCVQHNESDFQFVSRLLEEDGIAYHFIHTADKHTVVFTDQANAYNVCEESNLEYYSGSKIGQHLMQWEHLYSLRTGHWTLNDYDFTAATKNATVSTATLEPFRNSDSLEHYEYPGFYAPSIGVELVKIRMEAEECEREVIKAKSKCVSFYAGGRFVLAKHEAKHEQGDYIITGIHHRAYDNSYLSGEKNQDKRNTGSDYVNEFTCVPGAMPFRPQQRHQRPVMKGSQSAVVVGPPGEEIYTDEYGRIKVQFIWDREGKHNEHSSCFLRVMQIWAGNKWGAMFTPRIGHEVIVDFLDGDPDRPIVAGSVYNGKNKPPYQSKHQSGIKSRSTKGGSASNFNEIRFDDTKGAEDLFIQAEKTLTLNVKGNSGGTIAGNANNAVAGNADNSVTGNEKAAVGGNRDASVAGNENYSVAANRSASVGGNETQNVGGALMSTVGGLAKSLIGGPKIENIAGPMNQIVSASSTEQVAAVKSITAGASIMLQCGGASITLNAGGNIEINGTNITINGTTVGLSGAALVNVKAGGVASVMAGAAVSVAGGGLVSVKGGRIDLN